MSKGLISRYFLEQYFEGRNKRLKEWAWHQYDDEALWVLESKEFGPGSKQLGDVCYRPDKAGPQGQCWKATAYMTQKGSAIDTTIWGDLTDIVPVIEFMVGARVQQIASGGGE